MTVARTAAWPAVRLEALSSFATNLQQGYASSSACSIGQKVPSTTCVTAGKHGHHGSTIRPAYRRQIRAVAVFRPRDRQGRWHIDEPTYCMKWGEAGSEHATHNHGRPCLPSALENLGCTREQVSSAAFRGLRGCAAGAGGCSSCSSGHRASLQEQGELRKGAREGLPAAPLGRMGPLTWQPRSCDLPKGKSRP